MYDETIDTSKPLELFDPVETWKRKTIKDFTVKELLVPVIKGGEVVYDMPTLQEIREYHREQMDTLWDEIKRFSNPHGYFVDLSRKMWEIKDRLIRENSGRL